MNKCTTVIDSVYNAIDYTECFLILNDAILKNVEINEHIAGMIDITNHSLYVQTVYMKSIVILISLISLAIFFILGFKLTKGGD